MKFSFHEENKGRADFHKWKANWDDVGFEIVGGEMCVL